MADKTVTPANVLASLYAQRLTLNPPFIVRGEPPVQQWNIPIAGATITAGVPVYQGADNLFYPADANGADPLYKVVGIAENGASAGQPVSIVIFDPFFTPGFTMAIGDIHILSGTVGLICLDSDKASGWKVSTLGVAFSTTQMELKITRSDVAKA